MGALRKRLTKAVLGFGLFFLVLFSGRLIYGYAAFPEGERFGVRDNYSGTFAAESTATRPSLSNVASTKYEYKKADATTAAPQVVQVDQKYEKTAKVSVRTSEFEADEAKVKAAIEEENGIIQFQQKSGNEGYRFLQLQIGIPPAAFEGFVDDLKESYDIQSISITKTDKTNEYRELNAKRATLQNTRQSLLELKARGGKIEEYINLENRILEIDEQLQRLGVQLGSFDAENEFCTVKLDLRETRTRTVSFASRILTAFKWAVEYYFYFIMILFVTTGAALFLIKIWDRLRQSSWWRE